MPKVYKLMSFLLIVTMFLTGCQNEPINEIHGAIHRIEHNGNVVYLFGSLHVGHIDMFPLAPVVEEAMMRADVFAFEVDFTMGSYSDEQINELMTSFIGDWMNLPGGQRLKDVLPSEIYENLLYHLPSYDVLYEDVYRMNPVGLSMTLATSIINEILVEIGLRPEFSVDFYVLNRAQQLGKPIIGLEPTIQQMNIAFTPDDYILDIAGFTAFSLEEIFVSSLSDFTSKEDAIEAARGELDLITFYMENDLQQINALMQVDDLYFYDGYFRYSVDVLMNFRSVYYAYEIARLLEESATGTTIFITVGLSHVMREGEHLTNIVDELTRLGFEVVPIF